MRNEHADALGFSRRRPTAPPPDRSASLNGDATAGQLHRAGLDLALEWEGVVRFDLTAIRDTRDGVRGELTVCVGGRRIAWGVWNLASTAAREPLAKRLVAVMPGNVLASRQKMSPSGLTSVPSGQFAA